MRLNLLYGKNADVSGIDVGLGVNSYNNFTGIQVGGIANSFPSDDVAGSYTVRGIQIAGYGNGVLSRIHKDIRLAVKGIQIGGVYNGANYLSGIQIAGFGNDVRYDADGLQIGVLNLAWGECEGVQIGLYNSCKDLKGVQIGLINHIEEGLFPYLPIINAKF